MLTEDHSALVRGSSAASSPAASHSRNKGELFSAAGDNKIKVLRLFFDGAAEKIHIREIARRAGLSATGALKILSRLEKDGFVLREQGANAVLYRGNYESEKFTALKRSLNLYTLYASGLVSRLADFYNTPESIVLFGSFAKGEDTKQSDIDIAVITSMKKYPALGHYEGILKRKTSIHLIKDLKSAEKEFINSLVNGIVLYGYLEVL